ncbi:LOW QUALITY PROTEIN: hypothetical protein Cgig2_001900 [Carnegiea gigantea]|uniref:Uncharacterized protein n=1 Tax=Carnegiea gigantea TaxID=171969 RepID=A0A9Q1K8B1_9CARY|nr:LOW QUALITY PROTEIN: hypothetical protein Cgig2_001900 [Carnegiea gigantea]
MTRSALSTTIVPPPEQYNNTHISVEAESSNTTHTANAPLMQWRVDVHATVVDWADQGFGNTMEEEGRRTTPSSAARIVHTTPFHSGSDGCSLLDFYSNHSLISMLTHYYVALKSIDGGGDVHEFSLNLLSSERGAMIDSRTILGYLPDDIYEMTQTKIFSKQPKLEIETEEGDFKCFKYSGKEGGVLVGKPAHFSHELEAIGVCVKEYTISSERIRLRKNMGNKEIQSKTNTICTHQN